MDEQPEKTVAYGRLVARFGVAAVAAAVLAKWLSDDDADEKWAALLFSISAASAPTTRRYISRAEVRVLTLLAAGLTVKQAAARLGVSFETVKRQVTTAMQHTNGKNATHAVAVGIRSGQVQAP